MTDESMGAERFEDAAEGEGGADLDPVAVALGSDIRGLRKAQGLTLSELAERTGRSIGFLSQIFGPGFDPVQYRMLIFGLAMVLLMIWRPRGLIGYRAPTVFLHQSQAISSDLVKEGHG